MLDSDLAAIYGVTTAQLNQALRRNLERFRHRAGFAIGAVAPGAIRLTQVPESTRSGALAPEAGLSGSGLG